MGRAFFSGVIVPITQNDSMVNRNPRLPLYAALAAFVLYVCTMGAWVTMNSESLVTTLAGWSDNVMVGQPVLWTLTLPIRLLPAMCVPLAVKLLSALLAALIIGVLARTVQLLPWDHPWDEISPVASAIPVVMACVICGLEFSFWQEATSTCGELLDLLLVAIVLWAGLEYEHTSDWGWLFAVPFFGGLAMTQTWVIVLVLPYVGGRMLWARRARIFQWVSTKRTISWKLVLQLAALWLAGCSIYVLLPMVNGLKPHSPLTLHQAWVSSIKQSLFQYRFVYYQFWRGHRLLLMGVAVYYLVPILPLLVRMRDEGTHGKHGSDRFQLWLYRALRNGLLLACVWLAFDPTPGARQMVRLQLNALMPMLSLDYFTAMGSGFLLGNLLLVGLYVVRDNYDIYRRKSLWQVVAVPLIPAAVALLAVGLMARNLPAILRLNFHPLEQFGTDAVKSLPAGKGVMLCDFPVKLSVFQAALARSDRSAEWVGVNTRELPGLTYREQLEREHPDGWVTDATRHNLNDLEALRLLAQIAHNSQICYLHPSYGYYFEAFYSHPLGSIYELKIRPQDPLDVPALTAADIQANEQFWTNRWENGLDTLVPPLYRPTGFMAKLAKYGLVPAPRYQDCLLGEWYSINLDAWAVSLQRLGQLPEARQRFAEALQLNTNNLSARYSIACNTNLQAKKLMGLSVPSLTSILGDPKNIDLIQKSCGPFDEPTMDYVLASVFMQNGMILQAGEQFERSRQLAPESPATELALAEIYNRLHQADKSRSMVNLIRDQTRNEAGNMLLDLNVALVDSYSWLLSSNYTQAIQVLQSAAVKHPDDPQYNSRLVAAFLAFNDVTNAARLANDQVARNPDNVASLDDKATILLRLNRAADAVPVLDHVLSLTNQPSARLNRAFARIDLKQYPAAQSDLHELEQSKQAIGMVDFGYAIISQNQHDTNAAVEYLHRCLANTPNSTPLWQQATLMLRSMQPAGTAN